MDKKLEKLFDIATGGLFIAGLIFLAISIFSKSDDQTCLIIGLSCSLLGNLFNIVENNLKKKS
ncbi:MAG: hypothetical protein KBS74_08225 [Clostridiales bacterium]|nr:hypothetical protein [Candidatus Cacconaster stercorequi]